MSDGNKSMLREILLEGITKFAGEIIGAVLIAAFVWYFPVVKSWIDGPVSTKNGGDVAVVLSADLNSELERRKQEEERLKAELRAEPQRQLEATQRAEEEKAQQEYRPKLPAMSDAEFLALCKNGDAIKVQEAIMNGTNVNAKDNDGWTALMQAAFYGHTATAELLLQKGAYVNAKDTADMTALMLAAWNGNTATAELLLQKGAYVNAKDNYGRTALMLAAYNGHTATAELLRSHGAK